MLIHDIFRSTAEKSPKPNVTTSGGSIKVRYVSSPEVDVVVTLMCWW